MSKRELSLCIALGLAVLSGEARALGLGNIEVKSGLGQPLVAEIPLVSASPIELDQLSVRLASPDAFERVGLERPSGLTANLQFSLSRNVRGLPVIRVTTAQRFNEPMLNFLIEADWGKGAVVREFTALVDPPYVSNVVVKPVQAPVASNPVVIAPALSTPPPDMPTIKLSPKIENPLTQVQTAPSPQIAPAPTPTQAPPPTPSIEPSPIAQTPPPAAEPKPQAVPQPAPQPAPVPVQLPPPPPAPVVTAPVPQPEAVVEAGEAQGTVGPVKDGQTLWSIAEQARPDDSVSMDQMMLALLQANPEAFDDANVNKLKRGAVLRIPNKAQAQELSPEQAAQLIRAQAEDFRNAPAPVLQPVETQVATRPEPKPETTLPAEPKPQPKPAAPAPTPAPSAAPSDRAVAQVSAPAARLEIAPPVDRRGGAGQAQSGAASNRGGSELRAQLTDARETLAAREAELKELKSRVSDLESMEEQSESVIEMQNSKIKALEDQLKKLREQEAALAAKAAQTPPAAAASSPPATQPTEAPAPADATGITQSPWFYPSVIGGAALLLGGLWWLRRRKPAEAEASPQRSPKLQEFMRQMPSPAAPAPTPEPAPSPAPAMAAAPMQTPVQEDPISRLRSLLDANPKDLDAHLSLLREYYERGDKDAFENAARGMRAQVQTTLDARWREAAVMGLSLLPGHPLFSGSGWNAPKFNATPEDHSRADFEMPTSIRPAVREQAANGLQPVPDIAPPAAAASVERDDAPLPGFLQGMQDDAQVLEPLEFSVDDDESSANGEINLDSYSDIGMTPPHDPQRTEAEVMEEDDGIGTKIELAKAYLDIGDVDGARSMLHEVIAEAGPKGRAEAERLLNQLG